MCKGNVINATDAVRKGDFVSDAKSVLKSVLKKGAAEKYRLIVDEVENPRADVSQTFLPGDSVSSASEVILESLDSPSTSPSSSVDGLLTFGGKSKLTWGDEKGGQLKHVKVFDTNTPILAEYKYRSKYQFQQRASHAPAVQYAPEGYW
eukprot:CAMPEP_0198228516 /NCGR_PEP_ID=MMETSP1445-20131203/113478_1 /TAXON_ID=36898 /ORGANISM="Pyramimonas sp., Strain CCMP2087" /LENGTH=148 /DNA_ID=CAMNT_0043908897 /DNA_START=227 /DNA_END=670 /DNA_ORIENTATION=-